MANRDTTPTSGAEPPVHTGHAGGDFGGGSDFRRSVLVFMVVLVVVAAAYLLGRHQQARELDELETRVQRLEQRLEWVLQQNTPR